MRAPAPAGAYGRTKLAGERAVLAALPDASYVVRTAWLYGAHGKNFVKTMLRLARSDVAPGVVADQYGQPTWTADVAAKIYDLVALRRPGRHLPRDEFGPDDVVRLRGRDFPAAP